MNAATATGHDCEWSQSQQGDLNPSKGGSTLLCLSCDRCRKRKTKCDGNTPCQNCVSKYLRKKKLTSPLGIDIACFNCIYSPAKRRGPVPGQNRKKRDQPQAVPKQAFEIENKFNPNNYGSSYGFMDQKQKLNGMNAMVSVDSLNMNTGVRNYLNPLGASDLYAHTQQQLYSDAIASSTNDTFGQQQQSKDFNVMGNFSMNNVQHAQSQLNNFNDNLLAANILDQERQQLLQAKLDQLQHPQSAIKSQDIIGMATVDLFNPNPISKLQQQNQSSTSNDFTMTNNSGKRRQNCGTEVSNRSYKQQQQPDNQMLGLVHGSLSSLKHAHLHESNSREGIILRSFYHISINDLFNLEPLSCDKEYCQKIGRNLSPELLPTFDLAALRAGRFSELALGALVSGQVELALELSNATVTCLRECVEEPVHPGCMLVLARAYLLHGIFRSFRGDMVRYFKYRRVCLTHLSTHIDNMEETNALLAAISLHDAWAYMMHNACEDNLPNIDGAFPPLHQVDAPDINFDDKNASCLPSRIVRNPDNQMWIQGPPPIFTNNEAPRLSRSLDALSCAIRSCCDQANASIHDIVTSQGGELPGCQVVSVTSKAVMANEKELCSRNMVASASVLVQQESNKNDFRSFKSLETLLAGMEIFLEDGDEASNAGFTDNQIQGLLKICNQFIEAPYILWNPGPTYHMMTNATVMMCHLLNGFYEKKSRDRETGLSDMEASMFDEYLNTFISARKVLELHRKKLPVRLRCHSIPKANLFAEKNGPLIDLNECKMCLCRGCQNFVLMGCSPCVAAERAQVVALEREIEGGNTQEFKTDEKINDFETEFDELRDEFNLDDDTLLGVLSRIISG